MTVPAWVITGLLDSGKTTLINRLIEEKLDELDIALLRQMEREALLETVYDERRLSDAEIQTLLKERSVRALAEIHRVLDEDTPDETCFEKIERVIKVYEAIGADGGARHDF